MNKEIKYTNGELTIVWKPHLCQHSGYCTSGLPEVFKASEKPWIQMDDATTEQMEEQVGFCPSGALSCYYNEPKDK